MAFDQTTRNRLQRFVGDARALLADEFTRQLQATYGMNPATGDVADIKTLSGLTPHQQETAQLLRDTFTHYLASNESGKEKERKLAALDRIVREQAFTVLNRIAALRMSEARGSLTESLANGYESKGFQLFHRIAGTSLGETGDAYRHYLFSIFDEFTLDLSVLFDRFSAQGRLFPSSPVLLELLALVNDEEVAPLWNEDETIGWMYQFWNGRDEIDKMRSASRAPRNSREMAVRNQFFTPRYVVEFLTDNTLGRIWYEMTQGQTGLVDSCEYLVRRPNEVFLSKGETAPEQFEHEGLSQEDLSQQAVYIEHRELKDPRDIKMLDPACGSMHFGLYCFDLFEKIYAEAWDLERSKGKDAFVREGNKASLTESFQDKTEFLTHVPRLIIENNIHGVDIDPRAAQVAGLSLWQRAHNSWQQAGIKPQLRPQIQKSNIVCAEPMPGEKELLQEFTSQLKPTVLGQLVEVIFEKMELAGEAGTLLKIEKEIEDAIAGAKAVWQQQNQALSQFPDLAKVAKQRGDVDFDVSDIDDAGFWIQAEQKIIDALTQYASSASVEVIGQKQLFVADAERGFAFIELCTREYDVLLMNPPFGMPSKSVDAYIKTSYSTKGDVISQFFERAADLVLPGGKCGAITSRTIFYLGSQETFRQKVLGKKLHLSHFVDLGDGVLDAMVETCLTTYDLRRKDKDAVFIRALLDKDKDAVLLSNCKYSDTSDRCFLMPTDIFDLVSSSPYSYWVGRSTIEKLSKFSPLEKNAADIRVGLQTGDDFRFLRLAWEVPINTKFSGFESSNEFDIYRQREHQKSDKRWAYYSKTEEAAVWYSPINLVVDWKGDGALLKANVIHKGYSPSKWVQSEDKYFKPGFSYMLRSTRLVPYIVPKGCIPTAGRSQVFPYEGKEVDVLAICASNIGSSIARFRGEMFARPKFQASMVQQLPFAELKDGVKSDIEQRMLTEVASARHYYSTDETTTDYCGCSGLDIISEPKTDFGSLLGEESEYRMAVSFGLSKNEYQLLQLDLQEAISLRKNREEQDTTEKMVSVSFKYLSYIVGCAFGRWKTDIQTSDRSGGLYDELPDQPLAFNFDDISNSGASSLSAIADLGGNNSLIAKLRDLPNYNPELVDKALRHLGCQDWSELLTKPTRFFELHYKQYSQNRRYAPIYWQLQVPSGKYCLWVYYHKINAQTLLSSINDYVSPKLSELSKELEMLVSKTSRSTSEERLFDSTSALKEELEDFNNEMLRVSKFWQPNLNDGVQITAAPLWRLFQHKPWQKKLKQTWEKLEDGDYDWAHLAYTTWPERVLKKCHSDRSLAITHDVSHDLWHEVEVIKGRKKEPVCEWQPKPLSPAELNDYVREKIATDERLALYRSNAKNSGVK
ncbi:BREX-1 system adenine-specific DNA-methyltransferase PglX [Vibrio parahaemolyticus]|nr:BREX-1 system adenine-specific DNA-methyltransferase PglX [Vibrio parahaemolyticus]